MKSENITPYPANIVFLSRKLGLLHNSKALQSTSIMATNNMNTINQTARKVNSSLIFAI